MSTKAAAILMDTKAAAILVAHQRSAGFENLDQKPAPRLVRSMAPPN